MADEDKPPTPAAEPDTDEPFNLATMRPPPLEVGEVTHFSVELVWEEALKEANIRGKKYGLLKVILEQMDKSGHFNLEYKGMAKRSKITGLDANTPYTFRYRFEQKGNLSEYSEETSACTIREPLYSTHLHMAIKKENLEELESVLKSRDVSPDVENDDGFTPLMTAAKKPCIDAIHMLIEYGASVNQQNGAGKTALMIACAGDLLDSVKALRQHNADYLLFDKGGCSAIHWAVDARSPKLIDWMASDKVDFNIKDHGSGGWTPLIRCANLHGDRDVSLSLMISGADMNGVDNTGSTVLHHAVMRKHYDLVQVLLQRRADPLLPNLKSTTPWQIANSGDDKRLIAQLMEPYVEERKKEMSKTKK